MEKVSTPALRLRTVMQERELSYAEFGELVRQPPQLLNRYILGQAEPRPEALRSMALVLGLNELWLQGYDAPRQPEENRPGNPEQTLLPILGSIRAGIPSLAEQAVEGYAPAGDGTPGECFYLRVDGESMRDAGIHSGDLVLIHRQSTAASGQIVACMVNNEDATLKRFVRRGEEVILQPENPAFVPRILSVRDFDNGNARIVGVVLEFTHSL